VAEFMELVPHARFVDVSGAGHMVAGDENDAFTAAVVEFLGGLPDEGAGKTARER
jgi:pimeloyl-ACP methyl ester carboxylesterase